VSVAFRRDSDEEHLEPRFEIPIPAGPNLVTTAGMIATEAAVARLAAEAALLEAGNPPDDEKLAATKRGLRYWRTRLATAMIALPPPDGEVAFGARVVFLLNGAQRTIDIVGDDEADPANDRIAFSAPLARAMMGAGVGDHADFGGRADAIEIMGVAAIPG